MADNPFLQYTPHFTKPDDSPDAAPATPDAADSNPFMKYKDAKYTNEGPTSVWEDLKRAIPAGIVNEYAGILPGLNTAAKAEMGQPELPDVTSADVTKALGNPAQPQGLIGRGVAAGVGAMTNPATYLSPAGPLTNATLGFLGGVGGEEGGELGKYLGQGLGHPAAGQTVGSLLGSGLMTAMGAKIASGVANSARSRRVPTEPELDSTADSQFSQVRHSDVEYQPDRIATLQNNIRADMREDGFTPRNQRGLYDTIDAIAEPQFGNLSGNVTIKDLMAIRSELRQNSMERNGQGFLTQSAVANGRAIDHLDEFMLDHRNAIPVDAWAAAANSQILRDARDNWSALRSSQLLSDAVNRGELRAATSGSGANIENTLRQEVRKILDSPRKRGAYSPDEQALMNEIVRGTIPQNAGRLIGKLAATGVIPLAGAEFIAHTLGFSGGAGLVLAAGATGVKKLAEINMRRKINNLAESVRLDSALGRARNLPPRTNAIPYMAGPFMGSLPYSQP